MNNTIAIFEILDKVERAKTETEKISILRENNSKVLQMLLIAAFDERVEFSLPEGIPPFTAGPLYGLENALYTSLNDFYVFIKDGGAPAGYSQIQRENKWIQLLESVDPRDAAILNHVKDKKLPHKSITARLVDKAFPNTIYLTEKSLSGPSVPVTQPKKVPSKSTRKRTTSKRKATKKPARTANKNQETITTQVTEDEQIS